MHQKSAAAFAIPVALNLEERLAHRTAVVTVVGGGYVGLPLAVALARAGLRTRVYDVDRTKVAAVNAGRSYIRDVPSQAVREARARGFEASADPGVLAESDVDIICVPTPFTPQKEPDTSHIAQAAREIAARLCPGRMVVLRSTSYPGTTEEVVRPILESAGLRVGEEIFLAFAPERIDPGNTRFTVDKVPVVVGGCDRISARLAVRLFELVSPRILAVSSPAAAEMTKLLENVFRNVNIALVNQVAQLCDRMGIDVWEVVAAAATKPYGFMSFSPGLVGGHCIPVDPYSLAWKAREYGFHMDFIELAARVNEEMPFYVVNRLLAAIYQRGQRAVPDGRVRVLVLGVSFKKDVDDIRYSPALKVMELLKGRQVDVAYHDPYVPEVHLDGQTLQSQPLTRKRVAGVDCVVILTDHSSIDYAEVVRSARMVFDTRNATEGVQGGEAKVIRL